MPFFFLADRVAALRTHSRHVARQVVAAGFAVAGLGAAAALPEQDRSRYTYHTEECPQWDDDEALPAGTVGDVGLVEAEAPLPRHEFGGGAKAGPPARGLRIRELHPNRSAILQAHVAVASAIFDE